MSYHIGMGEVYNKNNQENNTTECEKITSLK